LRQADGEGGEEDEPAAEDEEQPQQEQQQQQQQQQSSDGGAPAKEAPAKDGEAEEGETSPPKPAKPLDAKAAAAAARRAERLAAEEELKGRRRMLGNIQFIGHLYRYGMLTENIMHRWGGGAGELGARWGPRAGRRAQQNERAASAWPQRAARCPCTPSYPIGAPDPRFAPPRRLAPRAPAAACSACWRTTRAPSRRTSSASASCCPP
jgi:hypothetical protein